MLRHVSVAVAAAAEYNPAASRRKEDFMKLRWSVALLVVLAAAVGYAQMPTTTTVEAPGGALTIIALGHASVQIEQGNKVVIVDPVTMMADLSKAKPADLILVTDIHPDHYDAAD